MRQSVQIQLLYLVSLLVMAVLLLGHGRWVWPSLRVSYTCSGCGGREYEGVGLLSLTAGGELNAAGYLLHADRREGGQMKVRERREDTNISPHLDRQRGYVIIFNFMRVSQQAVGLRSFVSAQCWLGSFELPMYVVQPFIESSIVHTLPTGSDGALTMSDFIDMEHYSEESRRQRWGEVASWEDFLENAPRNIIYVETVEVKNCRCMYEEEEEWVAPVVSWKANSSRRCLHLRHPSPLQSLGKQFCVVRVVSIQPNPRICNAMDMYSTLFGEWRPEEVTLIFQQWCPGMYIPNPTLADPAVCRRACSEGLDHKFLPSQQLLAHAKAYEALHSEDSEHYKVAAMLRSEHVLLSLDKTKWNKALYVCLSQSSTLLHHLESSALTRCPFLTVDVGRYGSNYWNSMMESHKDKSILQRIKGTIVQWLNHSVTFRVWENGFVNVTEGMRDRGYIAALQRTIASRADCLILLGGGNFLRLALHDYLNHHPEPWSWCLHFVCLDSRFRDEYHEILLSRDGLLGHTSWRQVHRDIPLYVGRLDREHATV